nr:GGDEF and EAL domain-containing protein [uncultured Desulfuromonas sp.]
MVFAVFLLTASPSRLFSQQLHLNNALSLLSTHFDTSSANNHHNLSPPVPEFTSRLIKAFKTSAGLQDLVNEASLSLEQPRFWLRILGISAAVMAFLAVINGILRWQVYRRTKELSLINKKFQYLKNASPVVLFQLILLPDSLPRLIWVSDNITRLFGYQPEETYAEGWFRQVIHPDDLERVRTIIADLQQSKHEIFELQAYDRDNKLRFIRTELQLSPTLSTPQEVIGSWGDVTTSREQENRLSFLIHYDHLTKLPNRIFLNHLLTNLLLKLNVAHTQLAVLSLDLDHFKKINETFGFDVGDMVLRTVAGRLKHILRLEDSIARIGGDEFALLLQGHPIEELASTIGRRILHQISLPITMADQEFVITASIGISRYPMDGKTPDILLKNAEIARYAAKQKGRNRLHFFSSQMSDSVRQNLIMENALRNAVRRGELQLYYQPQINLVTQKLEGVEALVRWNNPCEGLLPPDFFIPLAEEIGIIGEIGLWVLEEACRQTVLWEQHNYYVPRVAVNLAVEQIEKGHLAEELKSILKKTGLPAQRLELEVTESMIMKEPEKAAKALSEFRSMGISLAIDDFGTGYSSLAYLKQLPLDRLKIDRSFVEDIGNNNDDDIISRAIINLAHSLGMETVAEGIEYPEQLTFLRREGCEIGQGYLFSKPLPAHELIAYIRENNVQAR